MTGRKRALCVVAFAGMALGSLNGSLAESPIDEDRWGFLQGLPQASVETLQETEDGYLWVGTRSGLARFDGESFKVYDGSSRPALRSPHVRDLALGPDGTLWIATDGAGLFKRSLGEDPQAVNAVGLEDERIFSLAADASGLWLGTYNHGLLRLDGTGLRSVETLGDTMVSDIVPAASGSSSDTDGAWVATFGRGAFLVQGAADGAPRLRPIEGLPDRRVAALCRTRDGLLWIGTTRGVFVAREGVVVEGFPAVEALAGRRIFALTEGPDGDLWIGSRRGLLQWRGVEGAQTDGNLVPHGSMAPGLGGLVGSVFFDRRGQLWAGAADLHRFVFHPPRFEAPPIPSIESIALDGATVEVPPAPTTILRLPASTNRLSVELGLPFLAAQASRPRLEHRLGSGPWREVDKSRAATFDHFPAGRHVFEARTVHDGAVGPSRKVELYKAPEAWRHPLFYVAVSGFLSLAAFGLHRRRVAQVNHRRELLRQRIDQSMEELKILHGRLPICGTCRKIRSDDGYWSDLEEFMTEKSQVVLTHGICPDCADEVFGLGRESSREKVSTG